MEKNLLRHYKKYKIFEQQAEDSNVNLKRITVDDTAISFLADTTDPVNLNKAIEAAKSQIDTLIKAKKKESATALEEQPVHKCRVCGCTDDNCAQCIEKTGKPCHWVEEDLCSACVEDPAINVVDTRASQLSSENIPAPARDSMFFQDLALLGNIDITMRIYKKDGNFTINIIPGNAAKNMRPLLITGAPADLDREFIDSIMPQVKELNGITSNIAEVKKDVQAKAEKKATAARPRPKLKAKPKPAVKKPTPKPAAKKVVAKKSPVKKEKKQPVKKEQPVKVEEVPAVVEQQLF